MPLLNKSIRKNLNVFELRVPYRGQSNKADRKRFFFKQIHCIIWTLPVGSCGQATSFVGGEFICA